MGRAVGILLLMAACAVRPPDRVPAPAAPPPPRLAASAVAERVVLLSCDGLGADAITSEPIPQLEAMPLRAERVIPVNPTATAAAHATIVTGVTPARHGIVANYFHERGRPRTEATRGLDAELTAETIVDAARRAGKRVGVIAMPAFDARTPRRSGDWGLTWSRSVTEGRTIELSRGDFRSDWLPPGWGTAASLRKSFSPAMRVRLEWTIPNRVRRDVDLVAYDTTDDRVRNYDAFSMEFEGREDRVGSDGWFAVGSRLPDALYGSWSKIMHHDPSLERVVIYWGAISRTSAYPQSFQELLDGAIGFWPGVPDEDAAGEIALEQSVRLSSFLARATVVGMTRMPFHLLLTYQPVADQIAHRFVDSASARRTAHAALEASIRSIRAGLDVSRDALVVTGDHGVAPVDTEVRINTILAAAHRGWTAFASGNVAHIYRFEPPDDTAAVVRLLTELKAPDGQVVFEKIETKSGMSHPRSGDIVAYAHPRFTLSPFAGEPFASVSRGQHGGLNTHPVFHTILRATGAGVAPRTIPRIDQTEIAPFVASLLGIAPPAMGSTTPRAPAESATAPRGSPPR